MLILFVLCGHEKQPSGGNLYDRFVIEYLRNQGDIVRVLRLPVPEPSRQNTESVNLIQGALAERMYDLVVFDSIASSPAASWLSAINDPVRTVTATRPVYAALFHMLSSGSAGYADSSMFSGRDEETLVRLCDLIIVNSCTTRKELCERYHVSVPVEVCIPGKDGPGEIPVPIEEIITARRRNGETTELLAVGNLLPGKGYHLLVKALSTISSLPWRLSVAGSLSPSPGYVRELRSLIDSHRLAGRIRLTDSLPARELRELYLCSDVFIQTSFHESYGIALAEALYYGLPFVAFDSGAAAEIAPRAVLVSAQEELRPPAKQETPPCGFLVSPGDEELLVSCIRYLAGSRLRRETMSRTAFTSGERLPSWEMTGKTFHEIVHRNIS